MPTKTCTACHQELPIDQFAPRSGAPGKTISHCRDCKRARQRVTYNNNPIRRKQIRSANTAKNTSNADYVDTYLETHPCVDCGETDAIVLEFDHVRGKKQGNIADMVRRGMSRKRIEAEIAKCEVRCANCHRRVTAKRAGWRTAEPTTPTQLTLWGAA